MFKIIFAVWFVIAGLVQIFSSNETSSSTSGVVARDNEAGNQVVDNMYGTKTRVEEGSVNKSTAYNAEIENFSQMRND